MAFLVPTISYSLPSHPKSTPLLPSQPSPSPPPPPPPPMPQLPLFNPPTISPLQLTHHHLISLPPSATSLRGEKKKGPTGAEHEGSGGGDRRDDFYINLGLAVRTLREDLPQVFTKELNYDIYREDVTLVDPLNTFSGIDNYKLVFRALRFNGRILFREIDLEVIRIWKISENMILVRWNLRGTPRVPWEAKGHFQGTSRYKLDRNGKIYEHRVDNFAFNFPQPKKPLTVLDLVGATPLTPTPTFFSVSEEEFSSSWVRFYRAVWETLDHHQQDVLVSQDGLAICSL